MRINTWILVAAVAVAASAPEPVAAGGEPEASVVLLGERVAAQVPTNVRYVASGGYWEHGGDYGTYRVIVVSQGKEHTQAYTYIQWVRLSGQKGGEAVETASVRELNDTAVFVVSAVEIEGSDGAGARARLALVDRATKDEREGTLHLSTPGVYRFEVK